MLGRYFIDRSPKHFDRLMDYLRTGALDIDDLTENEMEEFFEEMDYYQLITEEIREKYCTKTLQWKAKPPQDFTIDHNVFTCIKKNGSASIRTNILTESFKFKLLKGDLIAVGFASSITAGSKRQFWTWSTVGNVFTLEENKNTRKKAKEGDIIECLLSKEERKIHIKINNKLIYSFEKVIDLTLYGLIGFNQDSSIEILE